MKLANIFEFYRRLAEANPAPETELAYSNDYQLLIAVVLSAQSTDVGVNKATKLLFEAIETPAQMVELGLDELKSHIKTIGLFNGKAKNVIALSEILVRDHDGAVPHAKNVGIHRESLRAKGGVHHHIGGFTSHTRQAFEYVAVRRHRSCMIAHQNFG